MSDFAVDLTNCDREPIHLPGAIQPFGFLIAVSQSDLRVTHASHNAVAWLDREADALIGCPLDQIFAAAATRTIVSHLSHAILGDTVARVFGVPIDGGDAVCDLAVHAVGTTAIIECEPSSGVEAINAGAAVRGMVSRLQLTEDMRAFHRIAARELQELTGFDRVMLYRFDHDGSGEVIAESTVSGVGSYLGLHYPASDIPRQARVLYERNWLRIIPDIGARPSAIVSAGGNGDQPLDLSMSILRSVSPIHIEYLQNMGVQASMSVSILVQGKLWGLLACHHYAPHHITFERRTAAELFGQMFSLMMENRERSNESAYEENSRKLHNQIISALAAEGQQAEGIVSHLDDIADLLQCDGIALAYHGRLTAKGLTPSESELAELAAFLTARNIDSVVAYHDIGAEFPAGRDFVDRAAGMLVVPLSRPSGDYLIFFRQEVVRNVNWAGDPEKPVQLGAQGARLTPRKSFELWKETVRGQSIPWRPVELRIAESLRVSLLEVVLRLSDVTASERLKAQERQDLLIAELNHRVRNILSLIRGVVNQSKDSATTIDAFTNVVGGRIHALARAHDQITSDNWQPASFRNLVMTEADAYLGDSGDRLQIDGPDVLLEPRAFTTVALVIHEMMTNAVKYGALSDRRGRIEITTALDPRGHFSVAWDERGGPSVERPTRRGFGSEVIERSITHDLTGEAEIAFPATGLQARFTIPGRFFHAADGDSSDRPPPAPDEPPSQSVPDDVLLVEDSFVIALDTEEMLRGLGISSVRTANGVLQAMQEISRKTPEFALLDVNLGNETSIPVAERLIELDVRFAFASGLGEEATLPASLRHVTIIAKPYSRQSVQSALRGG